MKNDRDFRSLIKKLHDLSDRKIRDWKNRVEIKERELKALEKEDPKSESRWNPYMLISYAREQFVGNIVVVSVDVIQGWSPTLQKTYILVESVSYNDDSLEITGAGIKQMADFSSSAPGWVFSSYPLKQAISLHNLAKALVKQSKPEKDLLDIWNPSDNRFASMKKIIEAGASLGNHASEVLNINKKENKNDK
jgi:hypothetical protein